MPAVERGARLRATLTDRTYRVGRIDDERATVFAPTEGECRSFRAPVDRSREDIDAGRIEVVDA